MSQQCSLHSSSTPGVDKWGKNDSQNGSGSHVTTVGAGHVTFALHCSITLGLTLEHSSSSTTLLPSLHTNPLILIPAQVLSH